ncbi:MAG: chorismate-binding protein [Flavobacteriales bacterium]|nr:chorismate-binding protein [Flavobacteriales bacterium]
MTRPAFEAAVRDAQERCLSGELEKAVLSRSIDLDVNASDAPHLFLEALHRRPEALVCLVSTPEHGLWLGASPERLILAENDIVHVDALAGTCRALLPLVNQRNGAQRSATNRTWSPKASPEPSSIWERAPILLKGPVMHTGNVAHLRGPITATVGDRTVGKVGTRYTPLRPCAGSHWRTLDR